MVKKQSIKEKTITLIDHMFENGWEVNHEFLENFKNEEVDLEKLIYGRTGEYTFHLISIDKRYTAKFSNKRLYLFKQEPTWKKYGSFPIGKIELTENGFAYVKKHEIMTQRTEFVILSEEDN